MYKLNFRAMGSRIEVLIASETEEAHQALRQVPAWFEEWEQSLSRFRLDSELSRLNRRPGEAVRVSKTLWEVLGVTLKAEMESGGLVTPAVLDALESFGYNRSFELLTGNEGYYDFKNMIPSAVDVALDYAERKVMLPYGMRLDLGGSAKGWAAHQAAKRLSRIAPALVNAGGDIAVVHPQHISQVWEIGVNDPFQNSEELESIRLIQGGVATSGTDYRRWLQNGNLRNHIIDPRTGFPVESDVLSATVIARNVMKAEMAAKTALLLGSTEGMQWLEKNDGLAGLLILENGKIIRSEKFKEFMVKENEREFA